jgi:hypothetical protein
MSSEIEARFKLSINELTSVIKSAKSLNFDIFKLISSLKPVDSHDDTITQILDQIKLTPSEQVSTLSGSSCSNSLILKKNTENFKEKSEFTESCLKRYLKVVEKVKIFFSELKDEVASPSISIASINQIIEYGNDYIEKAKKKILSTFHSDLNEMNNHDSPTLINQANFEQVKNLENQILSLKEHIKKYQHPETFFSFPKFCQIFDKINEKFQNFDEKLKNFEIKLKKVKSSNFLNSWQKVKNLQKNYEISSNLDPRSQELFLVLHSLLSQARPQLISPYVEIALVDSETSDLRYQQLKEAYEDLTVTNLELRSTLLKLEGDQTQMRKLTAELSAYKEKCELLEKVNKELTSKKNEDSDDSLDLDCSNIKDMIEIQELRAALRSMSERYEQEKETLIKDIIESRQDMETQIFRLQNEKNYTEVKLKEADKNIGEMIREKERLESIMVTMKKEIEKLKENKDFKNTDSRLPGSRRGSSELQGSGDFELTESLDKFAVNSNDLYEILQEELNEIVFNLQKNGLIQDEGSTVQILRRSSEILLQIKESIENLDLSDIAGSLSQKLKTQKQEIQVLSTDLSLKRHELLEKDRKIQNLMKNDHFEIRTEPSPRSSTPGFDFSSSMKHQLQLEKSKLMSKKHKILLHKEQIAALKQNIRDLQGELEIACKVDVVALKDLWWALAKEIPLMSKAVEEGVEVFMRKLGFGSKDFALLLNERKTKKGKFKFGLF